MAVVVSIARGHDASYPFRAIGAADGATVTGERGAGYYLAAVEKGGEPAGIWIGDGAAEFGFRDGETFRREDFEPLYGQFLDPRDSSGQTYLGGPPRVNAELAAIYQAKFAGHPGATADERMRLLAEARSGCEGPVGVQYFDTTFSVDRTISLAHASALVLALAAQQVGDSQSAAQCEAPAALPGARQGDGAAGGGDRGGLGHRGGGASQRRAPGMTSHSEPMIVGTVGGRHPMFWCV